MLRTKLREAMEEYRRRTGERMTYKLLAKPSGLAHTTLESLATRPTYNSRLITIKKLCAALGCTPGDLLELTYEPGGAPHAD